MSTSISLRRLGVVAASGAATLAAGASLATAQPGVRVVDEPFLGRISGGAAVSYSLDRRAEHQSVAIAGRTAKVKLVDRERNLYTALVNRSGLRQGRSYLVTITVKGAGGTRVLVRDRLFLHRSTNRTSTAG
jgi:hypothetical protein